MKYRSLALALIAALSTACSYNKEMNIPQDRVVEEFLATIEDEPTRVFADSELRVLWNADDRVSIFNKNTYNYEYQFTGADGDNSGSFKKVPKEEFVTGNPLDNAYSIYPYRESTSISNDGVISLVLPSDQSYLDNSFGKGANTMIAVTQDDELMFKNLCGYLAVKLYGDNVAVSSISVRGNNGEPLAGRATVNASIDGVPTLSFESGANQEVVLGFDTPVTIGSTSATATTFWFVIPPTVFSKGITLTVKDNKNGVFEKTTSKDLEIKRNSLSRMAALQAVPAISNEAIVFEDEKVKEKLVAAFDTNGDGELSYAEAAAVSSGEDLKNALGAIKTYKSFSEFRYFTSVKSIPESFFSSWNLLTTVEIPSSVESIGSYAFKDCIKLSQIILPNSLKYLRYGVFAGCTSLKRMIIPDSVSGVLGRDISLDPYYDYDSYHGDGMFEGCSSLEEVVLSKNLTSLGVFAFWNCEKLRSLSIPSSVKRYNLGTFYKCRSLSSIAIPESMTIIPAYLFSDCISLNNIVIPEKVSIIGAYAFDGCRSLTSIIIPESVTEIRRGAFSSCTSLQSIVIPESVSIIGEEAFSSCISATSISIPESISVIKRRTFSGCGVTSLKIPSSVTSIGNAAFSRCENLQTVSIPNSVTEIEAYAFEYCGLTTVSIPESITKLGSYAFRCCSELSSITLPNTEISLGYTFKGCEKLKEVTIPAKVGLSRTFEDCTNLRSVVFESGRDGIWGGVFNGCDSLESVSIPESVLTIGENAFLGTSLKTISLPSKLKTIGKNAFSNTLLQTITIPNTVESLGENAFYGCKNLKSAYIMGAISKIEKGLFKDCDNLIEVTIPDSVTDIADLAFYNTRLKSVLLPNKLESIGANSFYRAQFTQITIPENVSYIGQYAFDGVLQQMTLKPLVPPVLQSYLGPDSFLKIYVPSSSLDAYKEAWQFYASKIQPIPE